MTTARLEAAGKAAQRMIGSMPQFANVAEARDYFMGQELLAPFEQGYAVGYHDLESPNPHNPRHRANVAWVHGRKWGRDLREEKHAAAARSQQQARAESAEHAEASHGGTEAQERSSFTTETTEATETTETTETTESTEAAAEGPMAVAPVAPETAQQGAERQRALEMLRCIAVEEAPSVGLMLMVLMDKARALGQQHYSRLSEAVAALAGADEALETARAEEKAAKARIRKGAEVYGEKVSALRDVLERMINPDLVGMADAAEEVGK